MNDLENMHLIIGRDSFLGCEYSQYLSNLDIPNIGTSRRKSNVTQPNVVFMDLSEFERFEIPRSISRVEIFAGITGYEACATNSKSHFLNVIATSEIAKKALEAGIAITYISSSAVFSSDTEMATEADSPNPDSDYGDQKFEAERIILEFGESLGKSHLISIVRPTKILSKLTNPIKKWLDCSSANLPIVTIRDLYVSPVSTRYLNSALLKIAKSELSGIFHLSGSRSMSYSEFALSMISKGLINQDQLRSINVSELETAPFYTQKTGHLTMQRSTKLLDLLPQTPEEVIEDLS